MSSLLWPSTDAGVIAQAVVLAAVVVLALWRWWRRPAARLVVIGFALVSVGLIGIRAAH